MPSTSRSSRRSNPWSPRPDCIGGLFRRRGATQNARGRRRARFTGCVAGRHWYAASPQGEWRTGDGRLQVPVSERMWGSSPPRPHGSDGRDARSMTEGSAWTSRRRVRVRRRRRRPEACTSSSPTCRPSARSALSAPVACGRATPAVSALFVGSNTWGDTTWTARMRRGRRSGRSSRGRTSVPPMFRPPTMQWGSSGGATFDRSTAGPRRGDLAHLQAYLSWKRAMGLPERLPQQMVARSRKRSPRSSQVRVVTWPRSCAPTVFRHHLATPA